MQQETCTHKQVKHKKQKAIEVKCPQMLNHIVYMIIIYIT